MAMGKKKTGRYDWFSRFLMDKNVKNSAIDARQGDICPLPSRLIHG
jgi:hypothetical protein